MYRLKSVDVSSVARISGAVHFGIGLIFSPLFLLAELASFARSGTISALYGVFLLLVPFFYGLMGFLFGAMMSVLYNFSAKKLGGIEVEIVAIPALPAGAVVSGQQTPPPSPTRSQS